MKDIKFVSRRAWGYYHEITEEFPEAKTRATIAACFRAAWSESDARAEWDALNDNGGAAALDALAKMTWRVKVRAEADGFIWADWITTKEDARSVAGEAWARVPAILDTAEGKPLAIVLYRATAAAVRRIYRDEYSNPTAATWATNSDTGEEYAIIDIEASITAERPQNPEAAAVINDAIERAALNAEDRAIITATARGYTLRQIAVMLGYETHRPIQRRLDAIRARLAAELTENRKGA